MAILLVYLGEGDDEGIHSWQGQLSCPQDCIIQWVHPFPDCSIEQPVVCEQKQNQFGEKWGQ